MVRNDGATVTLADRKEREREQRHSDIISAAEHLFFSRGYDSVSMNDIAKEVELSKATLYLYFKDKEALYFAIVLRGARILSTIYLECSQIDTSGLEKIKAMGQGFTEFTRKHPEYFRMLCYSASERFCKTDNDDAKEILDLICKNIQMMSEAFEEGIKDGTVRNDLDPLEMAIYLCATRLCTMNLDLRWRNALQKGGISYDQFVGDFRRFIAPAIVKRCQEEYVGKTEPSRQQEQYHKKFKIK
jgi:TetR/AcrR family transcriptional regulator